MSTRKEILLASVPKHSRIIEIGPSFNPIAPKSQGWNSVTLDHLTREGLLAKYRTHPAVDLGKIEEVDFVWTGGRLSDAVPPDQHGSFDVLIASHVIEHTPDMVGFLDAAATLVKPDGAVILAVPDKRYCFDYFQQITTTGQILDAHLHNRSRHTAALAFDHFAYATTDGGAESWTARPSQGLRLIHELETARDLYRMFEDSLHYQDIHAWHFVPSSFELLLLELASLGETDWLVERVSPGAGWEFFAWLRRGAGVALQSMPDETLKRQRLALLKRVVLENQAQIDWLTASEPDLIPVSSKEGSALARARNDIAELQTQLAAARRDYAAAMRRVEAMEVATFWRISRPIRDLLDKLRGARTGARRMSQKPRRARPKPAPGPMTTCKPEFQPTSKCSFESARHSHWLSSIFW